MWIDEIELTVQSGAGGDGVVSFRHEWSVEYGGPNGGTGGAGGDIVFKASRHLRSLAGLRGRKRLKAGDGEKGGTTNCTGKSGAPLVVSVPLGTVVRRADTGQVLADLTADGEEAIIAAGGRGGRGNTEFATATNRTPQYREMGEEGKTLPLRIELKLIADVGLVGLPNAGKSTLLSRLSAARPKIADYPFTTLEPHLGIVEPPAKKRGVDSWRTEGQAFTMADLPGLIRGAHLGKGLGIRFLRHVERTRMILHLIDCSSEHPEEDYRTIRDELEAYGHGLGEKPSLVVFTKLDAIPSFAPSIGGALAISAHSGAGLDELRARLLAELAALPPPAPLEREIVLAEEEMPVQVRVEDGIFIVTGGAVERYLKRRAPDSLPAWRRFWHTLVRWGVADQLKLLGVKEGDTVRIADYELEYRDEDDDEQST